MTTKKQHTHRAPTTGARDDRCSRCGQRMTAPQQALSVDGKAYCEACYRDCFFADMGSHRQSMDRCAI